MSKKVPKGWAAGVLLDYVEINPRLMQRSELEEDTQVSFIRMEDVSNNAIVKNVRVVPYKQVSKGFTTFQNGDVLLAKITPCFENGKGGFVDNLDNGVGFGSTEFHVLRAKENSDANYIYQFTNYPDFRLSGATNMTGSAGQRRVPTDYLKTFDVVLPPLAEQQKIAAILSSVDAVIEKTRAQIDKLKDLKTGMMQELLTKGIGHSEFKDSPVGRIPKGWEVTHLGAIVLPKGIQTGPFGSQMHAHEYIDWGVPVIMPRDMKGNKVDPESVAHIPLKKAVELTRHRVKIGDLVFARRGDIGRFALINKSNEGWVCGTGCLKVRMQPSINPTFMASYLTLAPVIEWLNTNAVGQTMLNLNTSILSELPIILPSKREQTIIGETILSLDNKIDASSTKLNSLQTLKKALMQDLLTGKVRVDVGDVASTVG